MRKDSGGRGVIGGGAGNIALAPGGRMGLLAAHTT